MSFACRPKGWIHLVELDRVRKDTPEGLKQQRARRWPHRRHHGHDQLQEKQTFRELAQEEALHQVGDAGQSQCRLAQARQCSGLPDRDHPGD